MAQEAKAQETKDRVREIQRSAAPRINWDDANMKSSYANVCNAIGTREEVALYFGMSNPSQSGQPELTVSLSQRVILSPFAAKRLATLLTNVVEQYETRWGSLGEVAQPAATGTQQQN